MYSAFSEPQTQDPSIRSLTLHQLRHCIPILLGVQTDRADRSVCWVHRLTGQILVFA